MSADRTDLARFLLRLRCTARYPCGPGHEASASLLELVDNTKGNAMIRAVVMWMVLGVSSLVSAPAQAGVICSFTGTGSSGTDCLGQPWTLAFGGWGIPGIGAGTLPYAGLITATDFHWRCLAGCGLIDNSAGANTRMLVSPFGATDFWSEALNGAADTIDFLRRNRFGNERVELRLSRQSLGAREF